MRIPSLHLHFPIIHLLAIKALEMSMDILETETCLFSLILMKRLPGENVIYCSISYHLFNSGKTSGY